MNGIVLYLIIGVAMLMFATSSALSDPTYGKRYEKHPTHFQMLMVEVAVIITWPLCLLWFILQPTSKQNDTAP